MLHFLHAGSIASRELCLVYGMSDSVAPVLAGFVRIMLIYVTQALQRAMMLARGPGKEARWAVQQLHPC